MDSKTDMQSSHSAPLAASSDSKASVEGMLRTNTSPTGRNTMTGSLSVVSTGPVSTAITATSPTALLHQAFLGTTASDLQDSVDVDIDNIVPLKKQGKLNSMSVNARDNGGFNESMELSEQIAQDMANQVNHIPAEPSADAVASVNFHYYLPLHNLASSYLSAEAMEMVDKAFVIADKAHAPQKRASGEPYIIHPIAVATIIAQMHLDKESIAAALLHDTVEDTCVTPEDIKREFGDVVEDLVNGVTKLDKLRFHDYREAQVENFRKMILAMTRDIRVILIKLADRTHNMRTLGSLRPDKRKRIARETLEIFAPIANRLGISDIKIELEELGIAALYPMRYRVLKAAVTRARNNRKEVINNILESINKRLNEVGIEARVLGREKRIYSIYKKMVKKELQFREIMDVYAFRVILKDVDTCYRVLGQMHNLYKPRPSGFKDYIAIPKINGYQSLHTSLVGPHGVPIEIQIRTEFMDQMAARGVAAHWSYKENGSEPTSTTAQKNAQQWIKNIIDLQQSASNSMEFIEAVKTDLFPDSIFVFTPDGKIFDLPAGSTPVDFAYALHTDIGQHCIGARVNHRMFPLSRPLQSGQSVEIITSQNAEPSAMWLTSVVTPRARSKIRQYLKGLKRQECVLIGRRLMQNVLKDVHLDDIPQEVMNVVLKEFKQPDLNSLLIDVALGNILAVVVANKFKSDQSDSDSGKPILGTGGLPYTFAQCCMPIPGDEIIGHITAKGLVIHNANCSNVRDANKDPEKFIKVEWDTVVTANLDFQTGLRIELENRQGILSEISNAVDIAGSQIDAINSETKDDGTYLINLTVTVRDRLHLAGIMRRIKTVPNIKKIARRR
ncbi:MAG: bifunctional GTP diphosphokinase/guanosine-3',5'-bis pyrophosphate 3'-pyrophosphohydrolase [Anaerobiospirillum succiniciproducens]|uniref:bifunctional GTP diphosphokinase/guanosine-3',5'-bis pyrophosphate 3'-pyrophosphohydrolase n=1 Tax=Anaerobiospirillum succiniciproducens TaxID=13335 RepID=UPI0004230CE7|nr:bifunctional GTP diphosphokinase/guanosine-3',5'-bis pyrophosphate 3'-pyrophosphohydrolase [Anaerobiospirillum succiniciproducens]MDO4676357.1 bifunctional GTP diphosphokinase/guanosine-3',5'-bis pyrophosphate 3'-pyrophosphohydrolase [Anaerobiospirillum succiniciproducens]